MKHLLNLITDFLEYLETEKGRSDATLRNYDFYLRRFCKWAKNPAPEKITTDIARKYNLWLNRYSDPKTGQQLCAKTQNYHLIALRSLLKFLAKQNIKSLASEKIELAHQQQVEVSFLDNHDLERLLAAPLKSDADEIIRLRNKAILETLFSTGARVSELTKLTRDQINLKKDKFTIRGKGSKLRAVFLSDCAREAIKNYLNKRTDASDALFVAHDPACAGQARREQKEQNISPRSVQRIVDKYARSAGITKDITPHTLRHSFATDQLSSGADIRTVQAMLGHESITTTQVYAHVTNKKSIKH
ncbi:tyrosine-type recombinase/integrase [Patescibacteria group bacterium]|nr:tyrosine-type recombinase/integrase [Patescibacteria group bacterium]